MNRLLRAKVFAFLVVSVFRTTVCATAALRFSKFGSDCGKASGSLDGVAPESVGTYSADDIFGVGVYRKALPPGKHVLRVTVRDELLFAQKTQRPQSIYISWVPA